MTYEQSGSAKRNTPKPETNEEKKAGLTKDETWKILATRYSMGSIGFAIGGIYAMTQKRGLLGSIGFAMLGGMLGGGIGLLATRNALKTQKPKA